MTIMNVVNRVIMIAASFAVFAFGTITFLLLTGIVVSSSPYLRDIQAAYAAWRAIALLRGATGNTAIIVALVLALVGVVVLVAELWGPVRSLFRRREVKRYVVHQDSLGQVTVVRSMVSDVVRHEAEAIPGVIHAEPTVKDGKDGLHVSARASLAWDADAPSIGQALQERIKDSVQTHLGLPVAEVRVTAQTAPLPKEPARRRVA